ncbi:unnamed protein product [[Candida] boidinii]|nr:hypothetical protein B5S33_g4879 [[Candida] boidinii]GME88274.1 unnamed protein product [[Candida] boidinii]
MNCLRFSTLGKIPRKIPNIRLPIQIRNVSQKTLTDKDFEHISPKINATSLHKQVVSAFEKQIHAEMTTVQKATVAHIENEKHGVVVRARTGTGKTFAFGLPIIDYLKKQGSDVDGSSVAAIVISPTRDLASQIKENMEKLWFNSKPNTRNKYFSLLVGQESKQRQLNGFRQRDRVPPVAVVTPGRFIDMIQNSSSVRSSFKNLKYIVIDEADELLSPGFKDDVETIVSEIRTLNSSPEEIKTLLFSATVGRDVFNFAENIIGKDYTFIDAKPVESAEVTDTVEQTLVKTSSIFESYEAAIKLVIDNLNDKTFKPIIFLSSTDAVEYFHNLLKFAIGPYNKRRYTTYQLHGKLRQQVRNRQQRNYRDDPKGILVCSDVAARGLDFPGVSHVLQIGINHDISKHTHRVGRTGRAGKSGSSVIFCTETEMPYIEQLKSQGNTFIESPPFVEDAELKATLQEFTAKQSEFNEELTSKLLHGYLSSPKQYITRPIDCVKDASKLLFELEPEREDLPFFSAKFATNYGVNSEEAREYFHIPGPPVASSGKFGSRGGKSRGGNRSRSFQNDRSSKRSYEGNDRGYRNRDRSNNRDGYSRDGGYNRDRYSRDRFSNEGSHSNEGDRYSSYGGSRNHSRSNYNNNNNRNRDRDFE